MTSTRCRAVRATAFFLSATACSDNSIVVFHSNAEPAASITSHEDGENVGEGTVVTFRGHGSDPDVDSPTELKATWYRTRLAYEYENGDGDEKVGGLHRCASRRRRGHHVLVRAVQRRRRRRAHDHRTRMTPPTPDRVSLALVQIDAPIAAISQPLESGVYYSDWPILFEGTVSSGRVRAGGPRGVLDQPARRRARRGGLGAEQ